MTGMLERKLHKYNKKMGIEEVTIWNFLKLDKNTRLQKNITNTKINFVLQSTHILRHPIQKRENQLF
jgi:hypothetical protein